MMKNVSESLAGRVGIITLPGISLREEYGIDFTEPFIFWEKIDLTRYVEFPQANNEYFLSGVVSHMGDSGPSGHFIAYCKMTANSKWYCYNDSLVNESSFIEINRRGTPYILFYQKIVMNSKFP